MSGGPAVAVRPMGAGARAGWLVLVALSVLFAAGHVVSAVAVDDEPLAVFVALAVLDAATAVVLLGPYRRLRTWAWASTWVQVVVLASTLLWTGPEVWAWYVAAAVVMAVAQCATLPAFRSARLPS